MIYPTNCFQLLTQLIDLTYLDNFNGTLGNLGGDAQGLEERSLLGTHTGVLGGHHDVEGSQGSGLGGRLDLVGQQEIPDINQLLVGEDKADVLLDVGQQTLEVGVLLQVTADGLAHHGVLAHEYDGLASQRNTDLLKQQKKL